MAKQADPDLGGSPTEQSAGYRTARRKAICVSSPRALDAHRQSVKRWQTEAERKWRRSRRRAVCVTEPDLSALRSEIRGRLSDQASESSLLGVPADLSEDRTAIPEDSTKSPLALEPVAEAESIGGEVLSDPPSHAFSSEALSLGNSTSLLSASQSSMLLGSSMESLSASRCAILRARGRGRKASLDSNYTDSSPLPTPTNSEYAIARRQADGNRPVGSDSSKQFEDNFGELSQLEQMSFAQNCGDTSGPGEQTTSPPHVQSI
eukprot:TRINITY_DN1931_c0_g1_i1.p1 TRINITY_DN1931_c0_g1~~TRINITY_DN1931_c0_g1_i1.p1  ORF type:complete len:263 (+),score=11.30 TRINITY_DN1931_c0_g1_i1:198-986(+)